MSYPYFQITERCNMRCQHCCFSATKKGRDMSLETLKTAINVFSDEYCTIGGGEPTLHPQFWEILGILMGAYNHIWMATNGSQTQIALRLAELAYDGKIGVALSQDQWHDKIDPRVIQAFTKKPCHSYHFSEKKDDKREIITIKTDRVLPVGRGKKIVTTKYSCCCHGPHIKPDGSIYRCGCPGSEKIGHISSFVSIDCSDEF